MQTHRAHKHTHTQTHLHLHTHIVRVDEATTCQRPNVSDGGVAPPHQFRQARQGKLKKPVSWPQHNSVVCLRCLSPVRKSPLGKHQSAFSLGDCECVCVFVCLLLSDPVYVYITVFVCVSVCVCVCVCVSVREKEHGVK